MDQDVTKEFHRRISIDHEEENAAFKWLQKVGVLQSHQQPNQGLFRSRQYNALKEHTQQQAIKAGVNPEMQNGLSTPILFWEHIHSFVEEWHRQKMPRVERLSHIRTYANTAGASLRDNEAKLIDSEAQRQFLDLKDGVGGGDVITIDPTTWVWNQIFCRGRINLLLAREKTGKTALVLAFLSAYLNRSEIFLGQSIGNPGKKPSVIILGTDQSQADWGEMFLSAGMVVEEPQRPSERMAHRQGVPIPKRCRLREEIKWLFTAEAPCFLDEEGIEKIGELARKNPGSLLIADSLASLVGPLGLNENQTEIAEPIKALERRLAPHKITTILLHHAGKGREDERSVTASRGSTAITAAVSRIIHLAFLNEKDKSDRRLVLNSDGRGGKPITFVIEQTDHCQFTNHGDYADIKAEQDQLKTETKLNERQLPVLQLVRSRWIDNHYETTAKNVLEAYPDLYAGQKGSSARRMAFDTLQQLHPKKLVESRNLLGRNLYRPIGVDLSLAKVELAESQKKAPPTPPTHIPFEHGEKVVNPSPISPLEESLEPEESVPMGQGELLDKTPPITKKRRPHQLGFDDPHWGPRPTTNGKELG